MIGVIKNESHTNICCTTLTTCVPAWSPDDHLLFFRMQDKHIMMYMHTIDV